MKQNNKTNKAVVFSHLNSAHKLLNENEDTKTINFYKDLFIQYLGCKDVVDKIFFLVDAGIKQYIQSVIHKKEGNEENIIHLLNSDTKIKNILKSILDGITQDITCKYFTFIGLAELPLFFTNIENIDPDLIKYIGEMGTFTYDTTKFFEAIIRIARGNMPHLAHMPIIRIDEDSIPNCKAITKLIEEHNKICKTKSYFYFSGTYGSYNHRINYLNDFAVRTHWFYPPGTAIDNIGYPIVNEETKSDVERSDQLAETFLKDISVIGAPQGIPSNTLKQVISGAGLIMSCKAIQLLPPFMNFGKQTTWVDDFLKRTLHEDVKDIKKDDPLSFPEAKFTQLRHKPGETIELNKDRDEEYLRRLIRGCIFLRFLSNSNNTVPLYIKFINQILLFKIDILRLHECENDIKSELNSIAQEAIDTVIKTWTKNDYKDTESYNFASSLENDNGKRDGILDGIVIDAFNYLTLLIEWPKFVRAILRLDQMSNFWLFD